MKPTISDYALIQELKDRFENNERVLQEQRILMMELKTVNEKLLASEGLKSNFLSNIRNEINNPLASVLELSKNISEGQMSEETIKKFAALIYSETFTLDFQLRNIFASAEIEAGEVAISVVSVEVLLLVEGIVRAFNHQAEKKTIELRLQSTFSKDKTFQTDPEKLHLILSNLIANAIQYSPQGQTVDINLDLAPGALTISVSDKGPGISEQHQQVIFDRFKQLEEGSTKTYGGHGLGLCVTKALLEFMGSEIGIESVLGQGSKFLVRIEEADKGQAEGQVFSSNGNDFLFMDNESSVF